MKNSFYFVCLVAATSVALLPGCETPPPGIPPAAGVFTPDQPVQSRVLLPDNVALDPDSLWVATNAGNAPVMVDGAVEPRVVSNAPSLAQVIDDDGTIIFLAFLTPDEGKQVVPTQIGVDSTATALLFLALGGFTAPVDAWSSLLDRIENSAEAVDVSAAFETALAANPAALSIGNPEIEAALLVARETLAISPEVEKLGKGEEEGEKEFDLSPGPDSIESGVRAALIDDNEAIRMENTAPRRIEREFLQTKEVDGPDPQPLEPPAIIAGRLPVGPATPIVDPLSGTISFEATANTFAVPFNEGGADYKLFVFGPTLDPEDVPRELEDEQFAPFFDTWRATLDSLTATTMIQDILLRLVQTLGVGVIEPANNEDEPNASNAADAALIAAGLNAGVINSVELLQQLAEGAFGSSTTDELGRALIDAIFLGWEAQVAALVDADTMEQSWRRAAAAETVTAAALLGLQGDDAGGVIESMVHADAIETWGLRVRNQLTFCGDQDFDITPYREIDGLTSVNVLTPIVEQGGTVTIQMKVNWDLRRESASTVMVTGVSVADLSLVAGLDLADQVRFDGQNRSQAMFNVKALTGNINGFAAFSGTGLVSLSARDDLVIDNLRFEKPEGGGTTTHTLEVPVPANAISTCPFGGMFGGTPVTYGNFVTFHGALALPGVLLDSADQFFIREPNE